MRIWSRLYTYENLYICSLCNGKAGEGHSGDGHVKVLLSGGIKTRRPLSGHACLDKGTGVRGGLLTGATLRVLVHFDAFRGGEQPAFEEGMGFSWIGGKKVAAEVSR